MQRRSAFSTVLLTIIVPLIAAGCRLPYGGDTNAALGVPTLGNVRVVTTKITTTPDRLHYKWSLIGSSNWRKASAETTNFSLTDTYPLNSATERGGCNVYEADLTAERAMGKWTMILHGSDGTTVRSDGTLPAGKSATDAVQIHQDLPSVAVRLPADLNLATVGETPIRLQIAR